MPRPPRRTLLACGAPLSQDELSIESSRWQSLVSRYLGQYSDRQKPQVTALIQAWCADVVRNHALRTNHNATPLRSPHGMRGESRVGMQPIK